MAKTRETRGKAIKLVKVALFIGLLAVAAAALPTASAQAEVVYLYSNSFDTGQSQGANVIGIAVDNSTNPSDPSRGDIYVTDGAVVNKFTPAEAAAGSQTPVAQLTGFQTAYGVAVDPETGDVYVADIAGALHKFNDEGIEYPTTGPGSFSVSGVSFSAPAGVAVSPTDGNVYVGAYEGSNTVYELTSSGAYTGHAYVGEGAEGIAVNSAGDVYVATNNPLIKFTAPGTSYATLGTERANGVTVDPATGTVFAADHQIVQFDEQNTQIGAPFGSSYLAEAYGISSDRGASHLYLADYPRNTAVVLERATVPNLTLGPAVAIAATSATLTGHVDPAGGGSVTSCQFDYVIDYEFVESGFAHAASTPCTASPPYSTPEDVSAEASDLTPGATYHYRLVAANGHQVETEGKTFATSQAPSIDGVKAANVTAASADLLAEVNPNGSETTYHFEYGPTTAYGVDAPEPSATLPAAHGDDPVDIHLDNLTPHTTYHFRLVSENQWGTTTSEDVSFDFFPPPCPNAIVRAQTGSSYLPDCRAYELVSPSDAGDVILFPTGPDAPYATNPARFAFEAAFGAVTGTNPTNSEVDTYVSTRTDTGWVTKFVGLHGNEALAQSTPLGDSTFDKFITFKTPGFLGVPQAPSNAPYVFDANGNSLGRWPAGVASIVPEGDTTRGAYQPSSDFTHLAFSSINVAFTPNGVTTGIGSAYDYNTVSGDSSLISKKANGENIPNEPGDVIPPGTEPLQTERWAKSHFINFPGANPYFGTPTENASGVSTDGSHILMSTSSLPFDRAPLPPTRLYMRVNDAVTYEVSQGHDVTYVGMTSDGSKVFFTSTEQLTAEDHDHSTDLYMWLEATDSLKLISLGNNSGAEGEPGNTDSCATSWTSQCSVVPVATAMTGGATNPEELNASGSDNIVSSASGDVYFYSPELLDGAKGIPNRENLYDYHGGQVQFVTSLNPAIGCNPDPEAAGCSNGPLVRMQVSPDGAHAAFITADQVTSYNNEATSGVCNEEPASGPRCQEMYTYEPATGRIVCASCNPSGAPPFGDVEASHSGLFMSNDGRTFFYTPDALVSQDTNGLHDIYEYDEGRPQLITSGVGSEDTLVTAAQKRPAGLAGVSADGVNVYFSTYDSLVGQDHNGQFLKFYDARTNGGFPYVPPAAPCAAADECHGPGSAAPPAPTVVTQGELGSRGAVSAHRPGRRKHARHARKHQQRAVARGQGKQYGGGKG